ncbi:DEAD/DEAH box helicase [Psychrobacter sp. Ps7]|uniref:DEAD/DEAH box helicase n=1 Tax=Psychrobacter sp. Ps7 TaxID=2790961 RepID=UPI001EE0DF1A|nr:DEAD/DEAH box helicase [Psychrobacter sp. Ps7]MCG3872811.1 DEAD/DEAH box helicase [Psychrobacter sp. Ps7]
MKLAFWKRNKNKQTAISETIVNSVEPAPLQYDDIGLKHSYTSAAKTDADFYWESLADEELAYQSDDNYILPWEELFQIKKDPDHSDVISLLNLPLSNDLYPIIRSENGISDSDFQIILDGWCDKNKVKLRESVKRTGAIISITGKEFLLNESNWKLLEKIKEFSRVTDKNKSLNQKYWAQIRSLAKKSEANLDEFLRKTIVLAPEELQLNLRKNLVSKESVVEVQPDFKDSPLNWLQTFDKYNEVQDEYTISLPEGGLAHVIIEPKVKSVLSEIKKMPNRRIAGERAQTFLHNPFAQLGEDAIEVISPEGFEQSKEEAEIYSYRLLIDKTYDEASHFSSAQLTLHENSSRAQDPIFLELSNLEQAQHFIATYERSSPVFLWAGYSIDRTNYLDNQVEELKSDLEEIRQHEDDLQAKNVLDLNNYSDRVIGIGEAEKLSSEAIQKDSGESEWLPQNLIDGSADLSQFTSDNTDATTELLEQRIQHAEAEGESFVIHPDSNVSIPLDDAKKLLNDLRDSKSDDPAENDIEQEQPEADETKKKSTLLIANNIDEADFTKKRAETLTFDESSRPQARLPSSFRSQEFSLKKHQEYGIAWLQNLYQYAPTQVSGCLLADDMGLGKTLQLLCFIGEYLETAEDKKPALVVAPVSLLENWESEINRFFSAKFGKVLSLYGDNLKQRKIPKHLISPQLRNDYGITNLLEDNWLGGADIVLTTYETMRDLEFSLGRVDWSIMICDEAQKIKVPTAMVTKAAKAQKADFKIACTGTPVENSLVDLWCLFDFIQENLMGSLSEFNKEYRRPIEKKDDEDNAIIDELRQLIEPQVLRRMKHDVAELPAKHEINDCKNIEISTLQRTLYKQVSNDYRSLSEQGHKGVMLKALHDMRMICAHPLNFQEKATIKDSPKAEWLINTLETIKQKNEKVIIFTEFRAIQVFLKRLLLERFGLNVTTVNGDSNTNSRVGLTRQGIIDKFQETNGFNVIILSTVAVGFGVNIQKANHVIHYTRSWNPAKEDQATDRAYRIGQDKEVYVYYPSISADDFETFEIKLDKLLSSKRSLADDMLKPNVELTQELIQSIY